MVIYLAVWPRVHTNWHNWDSDHFYKYTQLGVHRQGDYKVAYIYWLSPCVCRQQLTMHNEQNCEAQGKGRV